MDTICRTYELKLRKEMRKLCTHQVVRLSSWIDAIESKQRVYRRCALKAADMGKRVQAIYWSGWAMRAESVVARMRYRLSIQ